MRIVATADLHGWLPGLNSQQEIPECDLLLIAGDVCPVWNHERKFQADWLRTTFADWLKAQPAKAIVGIGGNHDFVLQDSASIGRQLPWSYLNNEDITVALEGHESLKVWGSPYSNRYGKWAFMKDDADLGLMWKDIPRDIDILLVHGPPFGYGDKVLGYNWSGAESKWVNGEHVGSASLANQLHYEVWPNLKMVVFGHIHEAYGEYTSDKGVRFLNVSQMNEEYEPVNPPVVIDL